MQQQSTDGSSSASQEDVLPYDRIAEILRRRCTSEDEVSTVASGLGPNGVCYTARLGDDPTRIEFEYYVTVPVVTRDGLRGFRAKRETLCVPLRSLLSS